MFFFTAFLFLFLCQSSEALQCYACSTNENEVDQSCADDVTKLGDSAIIDCDKKYCMIQRHDYLDPKGKLESITRNCVDKIDQEGVTEDATYRTYVRSCKEDLCNGGSGRGAIVPRGSNLGDKSTIYCPGTGLTAGTGVIYASVVGVIGLVIAVRLF